VVKSSGVIATITSETRDLEICELRQVFLEFFENENVIKRLLFLPRLYGRQ